MTYGELIAEVERRIDQTDLTDDVENALVVVHDQIQTGYLNPVTGQFIPLDWQAMEDQQDGSYDVSEGGLAIDDLPETDGERFKRAWELYIVGADGSVTPTLGSTEDIREKVVRGRWLAYLDTTVTTSRTLYRWSQERRLIVLDPSPTEDLTLRVKFYRKLKAYAEAADSDWFSENLWDELCNGAAAEVLELIDAPEAARKRANYLAGLIAKYREDQRSKAAGVAEVYRPAVAVYGG